MDTTAVIQFLLVTLPIVQGFIFQYDTTQRPSPTQEIPVSSIPTPSYPATVTSASESTHSPTSTSVGETTTSQSEPNSSTDTVIEHTSTLEATTTTRPATQRPRPNYPSGSVLLSGCTPIEYTNLPWRSSENGYLEIQPRCIFSIGTDSVAATYFRLELFFDEPVANVTQWSFKQYQFLRYTNDKTLWPSDPFRFYFILKYTGSMSWTPQLTYEEPPYGECCYTILRSINYR